MEETPLKPVPYYKVSSIMDVYERRTISNSPELPPIKDNRKTLHRKVSVYLKKAEETSHSPPSKLVDKGCMITENRNKYTKVSFKNHLFPITYSNQVCRTPIKIKVNNRARRPLWRQSPKCLSLIHI